MLIAMGWNWPIKDTLKACNLHDAAQHHISDISKSCAYAAFRMRNALDTTMKVIYPKPQCGVAIAVAFHNWAQPLAAHTAHTLLRGAQKNQINPSPRLVLTWRTGLEKPTAGRGLEVASKGDVPAFAARFAREVPGRTPPLPGRGCGCAPPTRRGVAASALGGGMCRTPHFAQTGRVSPAAAGYCQLGISSPKRPHEG